jgi:hypothetical protein
LRIDETALADLVERYCSERQVRLHFIAPGKPAQNKHRVSPRYDAPRVAAIQAVFLSLHPNSTGPHGSLQSEPHRH